jgi:ribosomal protein L37AE/L43A
MLSSVKMTFVKNWVEVYKKYHCKKCGYRFYRKNRDWFTLNPLNPDDFNTCRERRKKELEKKIRYCPKCSTEVKPL